jgi:hypothetical protein
VCAVLEPAPKPRSRAVVGATRVARSVPGIAVYDAQSAAQRSGCPPAARLVMLWRALLDSDLGVEPRRCCRRARQQSAKPAFALRAQPRARAEGLRFEERMCSRWPPIRASGSVLLRLDRGARRGRRWAAGSSDGSPRAGASVSGRARLRRRAERSARGDTARRSSPMAHRLEASAIRLRSSHSTLGSVALSRRLGAPTRRCRAHAIVRRRRRRRRSRAVASQPRCRRALQVAADGLDGRSLEPAPDG